MSVRACFFAERGLCYNFTSDALFIHDALGFEASTADVVSQVFGIFCQQKLTKWLIFRPTPTPTTSCNVVAPGLNKTIPLKISFVISNYTVTVIYLQPTSICHSIWPYYIRESIVIRGLQCYQSLTPHPCNISAEEKNRRHLQIQNPSSSINSCITRGEKNLECCNSLIYYNRLPFITLLDHIT